MVSHSKDLRFESWNFIKIYIFDDFPQISTVKDFNFQLFRVLRGSTLRFDGSPLLYLVFYPNLSGWPWCACNLIELLIKVGGAITDIELRSVHKEKL